jgi:hypothetical protein
LEGLEQRRVAESLHALSDGTVLQQWIPQAGQLLSLVAYRNGDVLSGWFTDAERLALTAAASTPAELLLTHPNLPAPLSVVLAEVSFAPASSRLLWTAGSLFSGSIKLRIL